MASIKRNPNGSATVKWREGGRDSRQREKTFKAPQTKGEPSAYAKAKKFADHIEAEKELYGVTRRDAGRASIGKFFVEEYWPNHVLAHLSPHTQKVYGYSWENHLAKRVGDVELRALSPKHVMALQNALLREGVGVAMVRKALSILQGMYSFAVLVEEVTANPVAAVRKPAYVRAREPMIFSPAQVEAIRAELSPVHSALVSVLAYSGPRPEEALRLRVRDVGERTLHFRDTKRGRGESKDRYTPLLGPLAVDLRELLLATGPHHPDAPLFAAHDGNHWRLDDWRNWRKRTWREVAPAGSRPRDLRSSFITLRIYEGIPLTTIAREVGTSVDMLDRHYAGVIADWDGRQIPAEDQIRQARRAA